MKKILAMLWVIALFHSAVVSADMPEAPSVLIIPFDNASSEKALESLEKGVPDLLTAFLSPYSNRIHVLDRELLESLFLEQSLSWQQFTKDDSNVELGHMSQADYILRGNIRSDAGQFQIQALLYETETMRLAGSFHNTGSNNNLSQVCQDIAKRIAEHFDTHLIALPELPVDEDPEKNSNFISGLGYYHSGQPQLALPYFMKILKDDAQDESAIYWLAKSFLSLDLKEHANIEFNKYMSLFPDSPRRTEIEEVLHEPAHSSY